MNNLLPKAHFEQVTVSAVHATEFEAFCQRNDIPFEIHSHHSGEATYLIRAGIDHMDAQIMVYKMGWYGAVENDYEVSDSLRYLIFSRDFWIPGYDYELTIGPRNKEDEINFRAIGA